MKSINLLLLILASMAAAGQGETFPIRDNGAVPVWLVAGPFPNGAPSTHGPGCFGYDKDYLASVGGEGAVAPAEGDKIVFDKNGVRRWQSAFSTPQGLLDFIQILGVDEQTPGVVYAFTLLDSPTKRAAVLRIRSNDGVKVWLNQKLVHDHHVGRTIESGEDRAPVVLQKGENRLLVKVDQGGGGWGLMLSIAYPDGRPLTGLTAELNLQRSTTGELLLLNSRVAPVLMRTSGAPVQLVTLVVESGGVKDVVCEIHKSDWPQVHSVDIGDVPVGKHDLKIPIPAVQENGDAELVLKSGPNTLRRMTLALQKPPQWTVYLVQHVHTDIGYTRPQTEILPEHLRYIDYALDYCDLTDDYPDDAKFRWTCEVSWAVREYVRRRPAPQIERLKKRIAEGRIEVAGMFLNMSELATESAMAASLQPLREIKAQGIPVQSAMQNDVNGIAWCMADYFADIGVKYLSMGINKTRSILPFDKPTAFWWESPSGKRILAFRAAHYHLGNTWKIHEGELAAFEPRCLRYLASLEKQDYPFREIAVQFSGYQTDNSPPSTRACDIVKAWNEKYVWPRLRIATTHEFMQAVAERHAQQLPVYRAAWPDWWTDGFGSAARETAEARRTHADMRINQGLLAMARMMGESLPADMPSRIAAVQDALLFYDEHTFGAAESIRDPMAENSLVQWGEKSSYVWDAVKKARLLREEAMGLLRPHIPDAETPTIAVFNTLNWKRSGLVEIFIDHQILPIDREFQIIDVASKTPVAAQPIRSRTEGTYWALWAEDVPPLGYKVFSIKVSRGEKQQPKKEEQSTILENDFYRVQIDPVTGAVAGLVDKGLGRSLIDPKAPWQLGQYIYERIPGSRDFKPGGFERSAAANVRVEKITNGPLWQAVHLQADAPGCINPAGVKCEIRLYNREKRIELRYNIRKQRVTDAEAVYIAFPFQLADGKILYEAQGGFVTPGVNQLPGSASDWQTVQNFVSIKSAQGQIVLGSDQIPLVQFGDINLGKWQKIAHVEKPYIYSWVMNNYWFTNFRAGQEGEFKFNYYLTSARDSSMVQAVRFGWGSRTPLMGRVVPPGQSENLPFSRSLLPQMPANVLLVQSRPASDDGGVVLHIREIEGKPTRVNAQSFDAKSVDVVNVLEETLESRIKDITLEPYGVKFIRLNL